MKIVGLMPVRNEDWCLGVTARVALMWCDALIILDHTCTDDSSKIYQDVYYEYEGRVKLLADMDPRWDEMAHRQKLLDVARELGATHIAIIDADELLTANLIKDVPALVRDTPPGSALYLPGYNLRDSLDHYHANGIWGNRWFATAFPDDPRLHWAGDTFHKREPQGFYLKPYQPIWQGLGGVLHLWGLSERRLKAKHALYKLTERLRWPSKPVDEIELLYNFAIHEPNGAHRWEYGITPKEWLEPYAHLMKYLHADAVPWQEAECARIIGEHPELRTGLDLFGVV